MLKRGNVHPTILLCGPHSTGKTTLGRLIALYANCTEPSQDQEPCGKCKSCVSIQKALKGEIACPAIIEQNVADKRKIEDVRELIRLSEYRTHYKYRFVILDEVHNFTKQAFEASLKLFEESGKKQTRFILCTTESGVLTDTNRSRCKILSLDRIPVESTARMLFNIAKNEGTTITKDAAIEISRAVGGYPRDALNVLECVLDVSNGIFDPSTLPAVIQKAESGNPRLVVRKYVEAVLAGKFGSALFAAQRVSVHEYFIGQVIKTLQQILYVWVNEQKLSSSGDEYLIRDIPADLMKKKSEQQVVDIGRILYYCLESQEQIKRYLVDGSAVIDTLTMRIIPITRKWRSVTQ
jgi:DNA polymerase-3 subunit gamma/tau